MASYSPLDLLKGLRKVVQNSSRIKPQEQLSENVTSSAIRRIDWTPSGVDVGDIANPNISSLTEGTLTIEFHERGTYDYFNVSFGVWLGLRQSGSKGQYFNDNIRDRGYSYARVG